MNVKIRADGTPKGTTITSESGEDLSKKVNAVEFHHDAQGYPTATLRLSFVELEYDGVAKFIGPNNKTVKSIIYDDGTQDDF